MGSQKHKIQNTTFLKYQSSKSLNSYYVFTTFDGINLPRFASICHFRYIFHDSYRKIKSRKSCQNTANQSILGGKINMIKILFVCHGNICRSPMAEFVMKDLVKKEGIADHFHIASAATSREELGNPVYPPARKKLAEHQISCDGKTARQLQARDYTEYDLLIGMDSANLRNMRRICGGDAEGKIHLLLDYTDRPGDVADPWYTRDFEATWRDVEEGCRGLLRALGERM